jgi:hypothetical protein
LKNKNFKTGSRSNIKHDHQKGWTRHPFFSFESGSRIKHPLHSNVSRSPSIISFTVFSGWLATFIQSLKAFSKIGIFGDSNNIDTNYSLTRLVVFDIPNHRKLLFCGNLKGTQEQEK